MDFHYKFSLTADDYADFNAYTSWHAPWCKGIRINFIIKTFVYSAVSASAGIIIMQKIQPPKRGNFLTLAIILFIFLLIIVYVSYINASSRIREKAKKLLEKEENRHFLDESVLTISESGIDYTGPESRGSFKWSSIVKYANTKDYLYLYINSIQAIIIPKKIISQKSEVEQLDKLITEKIPLASSFRSLGI